MSERFPENSEEPRFSVSLEQAINDESLRELYFQERIEAKEAGHTLWMADGFGGEESSLEPGISIHYYKNRKPIGYVEGDPQEGYFGYGPPLEELDEEEDKHHKVTTEPAETLQQAQSAVEEYIILYEKLYSEDWA